MRMIFRRSLSLFIIDFIIDTILLDLIYLRLLLVLLVVGAITDRFLLFLNTKTFA